MGVLARGGATGTWCSTYQAGLHSKLVAPIGIASLILGAIGATLAFAAPILAIVQLAVRSHQRK